MEIATRAERALGRSKDAAVLQQTFSRLVEEVVGAEPVSLRAWLTDWREARKGEVSAKTFEGYRLATDDAIAWATAQGLRALAEIDEAAAHRLRDHWSAKNSAGTANWKTKVMRMAMKSAVDRGLLRTNPFATLKALRRGTAKSRRPFTLDELRILLRAADAEWRVLILLGLYTGQRLNDLAGLRWSNVALEETALHAVAAKTGRPIHLPLTGPLLDAVLALTAGEVDAPLMPRIAAMKPAARSNAFRALMAGVGLAQGLKDRIGEGKGKRGVSALSFHALRHSTTSFLKAAGVSDAVVQAIVGHSSKAMSDHYTAIDLATMRAALEKMPAVE